MAADCHVEPQGNQTDSPIPCEEKQKKAKKKASKTKAVVHKATVIDDGYEEHWPPLRKRLGIILHSRAFDVMRGAFILGNMVLLVIETDADSLDGGAPAWVTTLNYCIILVYAIELIARIGIYRHQFFHCAGNWFDLMVVFTDVSLETALLIAEHTDGVPSLVVMRIFRLLRLGRTHRALVMFPELNIMVLGVRGALRTMFWGMILICVVVLSFGILAVQVIHPLNLEVAETGVYDGCERCPRAFESVAAAALTFTQQVVAGDSWGTVTIPIVEHYPPAILFFTLVLSVLGMVLLNLILAVVIDSANQARQETDHQQAEVKEKKFESATAKLLTFCEGLDSDHSGSLSLQELVSGYEDDLEFEDAMTLIDINQKDMNTVFRIMDEDQSGEVRYDEFVEELYRMKTEDSHTMITFIKFYVQEIQREMREELRNTRELLMEFHVSVKTLLDQGKLASDTPPPHKLSTPNEGQQQKASPVEFAWMNSSRDELNRLLQNVTKDVQRSNDILLSLDQGSPLGKAHSFQNATEVKLLAQPSRDPQPRSATVVLTSPTHAPTIGSTSPVVFPAGRPPASLSSSSFGLRCCDAKTSAAHPPTSIL